MSPPSSYSPDEEAEEAEQGVHQSHVVGDAGDDGLLTVWTHRLHRRRLEHLPLQHRHRGGATRSQDRRRVAPHVDEGPRPPGAHVSRRWVRVVARWGNVGATCEDGKKQFFQFQTGDCEVFTQSSQLSAMLQLLLLFPTKK